MSLVFDGYQCPNKQAQHDTTYVVAVTRAATRNRVYTGNGCRHTGTVAVPAELGECAHPARPQAAEDPSDARAKTAVHGRIRVI